MFNTTFRLNGFRASTVVLISTLVLFASLNFAHAAHPTSPTIEALMKEISALQAEVAKLSSASKVQGTSSEHTYTVTDDGKTGRPKITINKPDQKATFNKQDPSDPIVVTWDAKNIPSNSVVEVELENIVLPGGGVGGGIWQGEIPKGDSVGTYKWYVHGIGFAGAGTYRVRTSVRACHSEGCDVNPRFPTKKEKIKTYAKSNWVLINLVDRDGTDVKTDLFKAILNGRKVESESDVTKSEAESLCKDVYNDYDQYHFTNGDVLTCYWGKKKFLTIEAWKG